MSKGRNGGLHCASSFFLSPHTFSFSYHFFFSFATQEAAVE